MKEIRYFFSIILSFIIFCILYINANAQEETSVYKSLSSKFNRLYNEAKYDSIYVMFSANMQKALPPDATGDFFTRLNNQVGKILSSQFKKYTTNSYAVYKTQFERGLLAVQIAVDRDSKIVGLFVVPYVEENLPVIERNKTKLILPFRDEWTVFWGGDTKEQNYHIENQAQKNAFDFIITDEKGLSHRNDGQKNEDYYAFGKEIIAPCDGEVVLAVDGIKDNKPGELNPVFVPGNTVIMKTGNNEYLFFGHFKQHTIRVREGQKVKRGDVLGLCGNTGNSSEAHLHFHIQNVEDMNIATGVKCFFDSIIVNGVEKTDYSPVKNDKVRMSQTLK